MLNFHLAFCSTAAFPNHPQLKNSQDSGIHHKSQVSAEVDSTVSPLTQRLLFTQKLNNAIKTWLCSKWTNTNDFRMWQEWLIKPPGSYHISKSSLACGEEEGLMTPGGAAEAVQDPLPHSAGASSVGGLHWLLLMLAASQFCKTEIHTGCQIPNYAKHRHRDAVSHLRD